MEERVASIFQITSGISNPSKVLDTLGVIGRKTYKECPEKCNICDENKFASLELVGVDTEPVFWECDSCGALLCIKERDWIEDKIAITCSYWTNPDDWEIPARKTFN